MFVSILSLTVHYACKLWLGLHGASLKVVSPVINRHLAKFQHETHKFSKLLKWTFGRITKTLIEGFWSDCTSGRWIWECSTNLMFFLQNFFKMFFTKNSITSVGVTIEDLWQNCGFIQLLSKFLRPQIKVYANSSVYQFFFFLKHKTVITYYTI